MIEYRCTVFVGMQNHTWYEVECVYLADSDEGDARALEAMEQQVLNTLPQNAPVAFVLASPPTLEIIEEEDVPDYDTNCKICGGGTKLAAIASGEAEWHRCQETCKQLLPYMPHPPAYDPNIPVLNEDEIRDKYESEDEEDDGYEGDYGENDWRLEEEDDDA